MNSTQQKNLFIIISLLSIGTIYIALEERQYIDLPTDIDIMFFTVLVFFVISLIISGIFAAIIKRKSQPLTWSKTLRYTIYVFVILIIGSFRSGLKINNYNYANKTITLTNECDTSVLYGNVKICLPFIDGMKECSSLPSVKATLDLMEVKNEYRIAYYVTNKDYIKLLNQEDISLNDNVKIFSFESLIGSRVGQNDFNEYTHMMGKNYIKENWIELKDLITDAYEKLDNRISVGNPVVIEEYSLNDKTKTLVILSKYKSDLEEYLMAMTINAVYIKESLMTLSYYKIYEGKETIKDLKSKSDYFVLRFIDENSL